MRGERSQNSANDGENGEKGARQWRASHVFWCRGRRSEEQALVEHSAACCVRLRAFRTRSYNFRSRKKPEKLTTEVTASQKGKVQGSSV